MITEFMYTKLSKRLSVLKAELPDAKAKYKAAYDLGDLRENEEYATARDKLNKLRLEISTTEELMNSDIISYDKSDRITLGSIVVVENQELPDSKAVYLIENIGGPLLEGVLNTSSPLGSKVLNQTSGDFEVNGYTYKVTKIQDLQDPVVNEFIDKYSGDDMLPLLFEDTNE